MRRRTRLARWFRLAASVALLAHAAVARAEDDPGVARHAGVGYHLGNGMGFLGADVFGRVSPRIALELEVAYAEGGASRETVYGVAPVLRMYLRSERSSPFTAVGASLAWKRLQTPDLERASWLRHGLFWNVGYEWRSPSGLGVVVGAGIGWAPEVTVETASGTVRDERFLGVNLEAGVRYALL